MMRSERKRKRKLLVLILVGGVVQAECQALRLLYQAGILSSRMLPSDSPQVRRNTQIRAKSRLSKNEFLFLVWLRFCSHRYRNQPRCCFSRPGRAARLSLFWLRIRTCTYLIGLRLSFSGDFEAEALQHTYY